jgi:polyhydroxyalkanoate synthesis regulator phasin
MATPTQQSFLEAVATMKAFPTEYIEHLTALAPLMSDEQCNDLLKKLVPMHDEAERLSQEILKEADEGIKQMQAFRKNELPDLIAEAETSEHSSAESILDDPTV